MDANKIEVEYEPTALEVAGMIWSLGSDEQADMFNHLLELAGSEHTLMMQFMACRDECEVREDDALAAFQAMFSSAYKYMTI